jgi:hypothetical protein
MHLTEIQAASGVPFLVRIKKEKREKQIDARAQGASSSYTHASQFTSLLQAGDDFLR